MNMTRARGTNTTALLKLIYFEDIVNCIYCHAVARENVINILLFFTIESCTSNRTYRASHVAVYVDTLCYIFNIMSETRNLTIYNTGNKKKQRSV